MILLLTFLNVPIWVRIAIVAAMLAGSAFFTAAIMFGVHYNLSFPSYYDATSPSGRRKKAKKN